MKLQYYRLQKISEGSISLGGTDDRPLDGPTEVGSGAVREQPVALSRLIDLVNQRFGTEFTEADQLFLDQIVEAALLHETLQQAAKANPQDRFVLVLRGLLESLFIERMDQNVDIFAGYMNEPGFRKVVDGWLSDQVYRRLSDGPAAQATAPE